MNTTVDFEKIGSWKAPRTRDLASKIDPEVSLSERPSQSRGQKAQQGSTQPEMPYRSSLPAPKDHGILPVHANFTKPQAASRLPETPCFSGSTASRRSSTLAMYPPSFDGMRSAEDPLPHPDAVMSATKMERCYSYQPDRAEDLSRNNTLDRQYDFSYRPGFRVIDWRPGSVQRTLEVRTSDQGDSRWHSTYPDHSFGPSSAENSNTISPATPFSSELPQAYPSRVQYDYTPVEVSAERGLSDSGAYNFSGTMSMSDLSLQRYNPPYPLMEPYRPLGAEHTGADMMSIDAIPRMRPIDNIDAVQMYRTDSMEGSIGYGLAHQSPGSDENMSGNRSSRVLPGVDQPMRH